MENGSVFSFLDIKRVVRCWNEKETIGLEYIAVSIYDEHSSWLRWNNVLLPDGTLQFAANNARSSFSITQSRVLFKDVC